MTEKRARIPRILVLEALNSSSDCVVVAGGEADECSPSHNVTNAIAVIDEGDWDGLLLTGGGDVDPRMYNQTPMSKVYGVSENRDLVETYALEAARERDLPVLGICRGAQIINVEAGGTLVQHIEGHRGTDHKVLTRVGTIMRDFAGEDPKVISLHHQMIDAVAPGFQVTGRAVDGVIETIEAESGRVLGVQFHPEMDYMEPYAQGIFRWLVVEAATRAGLPVPEPGEAPKTSKWSSGYSTSRHHSVSKKGKRGNKSGKRTKGRGKTSTLDNVKSFWICPHCALRFEGLDAQKNRDDHVTMIHGGMVTTAPRVREPEKTEEQLEHEAMEAARRLRRLASEPSEDLDVYEPDEIDAQIEQAFGYLGSFGDEFGDH